MSELVTPESSRQQIIAAIRAVRTEIRWKSGKDIQHLKTRRDHGHISKTATLADYHDIIKSVLSDSTASVYLYRFGPQSYPTVVTTLDTDTWLVMFGLDGLMETAFIVEWPDQYLNRLEFEFISTLGDLMK